MNKHELLAEFLETWPLERVQAMSLEEYTNTNRSDSFCYWIERRTDSLGGISGGSSFKFGIYKKATEDAKEEVTSKKVSSDGVYVWLDKYGNSKDEAFEKVKSLVIAVIEASKAGRFSAIDAIDLGDATKWKIAFLYSDYKLINTFNYDNLLSICDDLEIPTVAKEPISSLSQKILSKKVSDEDFFEFGSQFWIQPLVSQNLKKTLLKNIQNVQVYFEVMDLIVNHFNLQKSDPRFYFNYDKGQLIFTIGQRYVWNLYNGMFRYISKERFESQYEEFISAQKIEAYSNQTLNVPTPDSLFLRMRDAIEWELKRTEISGFKKYNKADFERLVFDKEYRQSIYHKFQILSNTKNSTLKPLVNTNNMSKSPLNQILYGPPGTGKTYNTINKAVTIANPSFDLSQDRAIVKVEYKRLVDAGQIVFTTFHQSMSYEDFVEGIKPVIDEDADGNKQVVYEVQKGVFMAICEKASMQHFHIQHDIDWASKNYFKISIGGIGRPDVHNYSLENNVIALGFDLDKDMSDLKGIQDWNTFKSRFESLYPEVSKTNVHATHSAFRFLVEMKAGDIVIASKGNSIIDAIGIVEDAYFFDVNASIEFKQFRKVKWLVKDLNTSASHFYDVKLAQLTLYKLDSKYVKLDALKELFTSEDQKEEEKKPHVLIIDEINRGNVSAIFGELITLLEDSKRAGKDEALEIMLPYSKKKFSVPQNLYIIGTMNTADRSVEALDTALRRRFVFEEMLPQPELLKQSLYGHPASAILERINLRIEKLIDRDHCIGHAYFLHKDEEAIIDSFYKNIIPLLQEYFFGDYGKIGLVLGKGFVRLKESTTALFADFAYDYKEDLENRSVYEIIDYRRKGRLDKEGFQAAITALMNNG